MNISEFGKILAAVIILTLTWSFVSLLSSNFAPVPQILLFSLLIVLIAVFSKKIMAHLLDADVEHDILRFQRFGFSQDAKFDKPLPAGIIFPLVLSIFTLGLVKFGAILTYETRAKTSRKAKRFGYYSYSEMTDWHNGIIGCAGIISVLVLGAVAYFLPINIELLTKMSIYYAFWNLIPFSNLDGTQIFFGSRTIWAILATITVILTFLSFMI